MNAVLATGAVRKMETRLQSPVSYHLPLGDERVDMNALLGSVVQLSHDGAINCMHCGRKTSKSFNQGYCYPCFTKLAQCDSCIVSPEKCHYDQGTCREPEWAGRHCMIDHVVYLANSSNVKVGITRRNQVQTRWMDQGALQALPIFHVASRHQSGLVEMVFKQHISDKTDWRAMLRGNVEPADLPAERDRLMALCEPEIADLQGRFGVQAIQPVTDAEPVDIRYPVQQHPQTVTSHNLDKEPNLRGTLLGIKGQYLIFDTAVINMRKYGGYNLSLSL